MLTSGDEVILTRARHSISRSKAKSTDSLRFVRDDELDRHHPREAGRDGGKATIRITMPPPQELVQSPVVAA